MIPGATVIFTDEFIEEIERHKENWKMIYETEDFPKQKEEARQRYEEFSKKLEWAIEFRDTIERFQFMDLPNMMVVKTLEGYELPAKYLQVV